MDVLTRDKQFELSSEIGNRLKRLRNDKGLTQKELAAKIHDGVDYTYIGKIERGQQLPSLKVLLKISENLSVPVSYFLREETETVVYVNYPADLGDFLRNETGQQLIKALKQLQPTDVPLIIEIIRILARHRESELSGDLGDCCSLPMGMLQPSKKKAFHGKSKSGK